MVTTLNKCEDKVVVETFYRDASANLTPQIYKKIRHTIGKLNFLFTFRKTNIKEMARKSRYEHLREGAKELYRKGMGSPSIAKELIDKDTGLTFNDHEALSRQIRKWAKDQNWPKPEDKQVLNIPKKILLFDIETAPLQCYAWGIWGQNINPDFLIRDWFVLCWSAKWIFEDKVYQHKGSQNI